MTNCWECQSMKPLGMTIQLSQSIRFIFERNKHRFRTKKTLLKIIRRLFFSIRPCQIYGSVFTAINLYHSNLTVYSIHQKQTAFENIVGKGEIARDEQFLLFLTKFSNQADNCIPIYRHFCHHIFSA